MMKSHSVGLCRSSSADSKWTRPYFPGQTKREHQTRTLYLFSSTKSPDAVWLVVTNSVQLLLFSAALCPIYVSSIPAII